MRVDRPRKILAVASAGGHWIQLRRLLPAFAGSEVVFVTTNPGYRGEVSGAGFWAVNDANRWNKLGLARMLARIAWILLRERPDVVISTGAAPGYFALRLGKLLGARTIWVDSIANVERMSLSGQLVRRYADLWLTQWPHLAGSDGPEYSGAVL
jgi:UDP-N-acetylglucosamine:LPS N-acetylglucosamine transferase